MPAQTFEFDFDPKYRGLLRLIGVHPGNSGVEITDDDHLRVRFGRWKLDTPLSNITGIEVSGDYKWYKAIGARGSFVDRGVTFGTNTRKGVCVKFREPVPSLVIGDMMKHPGMTLTVSDPDGFVAALVERGVPAPA